MACNARTLAHRGRRGVHTIKTPVSAPEHTCCPDGQNEADPDLEIPADWGRAADLVARGEVRRALVVGPPDVGKSSLCRVILAGAAPRRAVALLDGDVGQKIIGPPACVTLGRSSPGQGLAPCALAFVGTTEPVCGWRRVIEGLHRLTAQEGPEVVVVNTGRPALRARRLAQESENRGTGARPRDLTGPSSHARRAGTGQRTTKAWGSFWTAIPPAE